MLITCRKYEDVRVSFEYHYSVVEKRKSNIRSLFEADCVETLLRYIKVSLIYLISDT